MTPLEVQTFVRHWLNAVITENQAGFSDLVDHETVDLNTGTKTSAQAFEARAEAIRNAFGELQADFDELLLEGDRIAWRWRISGVHRAPFLGEPASGQRITLRGVNFQRLANGRVIEHYTLLDMPHALSAMRDASRARRH